MTRTEALALLDTYIENHSLKKHCLAVGAALKAYAVLFHEDADLWEITGLLHDMDYEKFPDIHPDKSLEILTQMGERTDMIHAIKSHKYTDEIESLLDKTLFACDEISGFIIACVLVRPDKSITELESTSVNKKLKDKAFAKNVSREDILKGAQLLNIELTEHITTVIQALTANRTELGI